jgi:hypothetical protein
MAYESKPLEGNLFSENDAQVVCKGKINIGGKDEYVALVRSRNKSGDDVYELMTSLGRIYKNENKPNPKGPDMGGKITVNGVQYRFASWQNTSQNGSDYHSAKLTINEQESPF